MTVFKICALIMLYFVGRAAINSTDSVKEVHPRVSHLDTK